MSADFMTRNLDRRVEVGIQITNKTNHNALVDYFNIQWKDNEKARLILPPYENKYVSGNGESRRSQEELYDYFKQKN